MKPWGEEHTVIEGDTDKTRIFLPQEEGKEAPEEKEGPLIFAWLVGLTEPHLDRSFRIASERFSIGKNPGNSLIIPVPYVSAQHASIFFIDGTFSIDDLHSSNGTTVNGVRVERAPLKDDDIVAFGPVSYRFKWLPLEKEE